jgi:hypothetical protein
MSIDARVRAVYLHENGGGSLELEDRPRRPGGVPGIAGQKRLSFDAAPEEVTALNGREVWGGSGFLMLGDVEIAKRVGYTRIEFHDRETFIRAIRAIAAKEGTR